MIVHRFLDWVGTAPAPQRAEAAAALARAWLYSTMSEEEREAAEAALTLLLDDPAPQVRLALAQALGGSLRAPRHIILSLANDATDIAAIVVRRSPILTDAELVDFVAASEEPLPASVAQRPNVSAAVCGAVAEVGSRATCAALLDNPKAMISRFSMSRIAARFGDEPDIRDRLFARADTPLEIRQQLLKQLTDCLSDHPLVQFGLRGRSMDSVMCEARDQGTLALAGQAAPEEVAALVEHLRASGQLSASLLLRGLCIGNMVLFEAAIARLAHTPVERVARIISAARSASVRALFSKAGLPERTHPAFMIGVEVWRELRSEGLDPRDPWVSRRMIERVLGRYEQSSTEEMDDLVTMLRKLEMVAARSAARSFKQRLCAA